MFRQLRNRFLLLNLSIISIMMLIAFSSIYIITYNNVRNSINIQMVKLSDPNKKFNDGPREPKLNENFEHTIEHEERSLSFTLNINSDNNIEEVFSVFDMDEAFYKSLKDKALEMNSNKGMFELDDAYWAFSIIPYKDNSGYKIIFLDITSSHNYLRNLIYTFSIVALVMLIVIFFISKFFANKAIAPIKETFEKQKQFIADASHELKTPLAIINTNADVLLSNGEDTINNQSKWLYYIKSEVERMSKLTNDLLYLAQADHSDIKLIYTDFNLSEIVEDVNLTMEASIFENNMILESDIEPEVMIHGNMEQIKQIVIILLDNALKYTDPKGKISLTLNKTNTKAIIKVTNTGKGIPSEHLDKIFDRFYCVDKSRSRKSGGYGLGLSIAKSIVEQHSGKIYAESIINEKTSFTVELPRINK